MLLSLKPLRGVRHRLSFCTSSRIAPLSGRRFLCAAAQEPVEEEEDCHDEGVLSKRALMQNEGFTEPQIKAVLDVDPRSDRLALLLTILKDHDITGPTAGSFVSSHIRLLHRSLKQFCLRLQILEDAGISSILIKKAILQPAGYISRSASSENLQKHFSFLKDLGLSPQESCFTMMRSPGFMGLDIDRRLKPRCEFLYAKGVSNQSMCQILRNYPRIFSCSEAAFLEKLQLIEEFGISLKDRHGVRALGVWSQYSVPNLRAKFDFLKSLEIPHKEATVLVRLQPSVLCMKKEHLVKRFKFLLHTMKLSVKDLLKCSSALSCSLEKRVIPRYAILQDLKEKGLLTKPVSASLMIAPTNERFAKRFNVDPQLLG